MRISTALLPVIAALLSAARSDVALSQLPPSGPATAAADTSTARRFDIPAQPLAQAILAFEEQSAIDVGPDGIDLGQARSFAVNGSFTSAQALRLLLTGTALAPRFLDERTVELRPTASPIPH